MTTINPKHIDWKKCNRHLKELIPQIKDAIRDSEYQELENLTKDVKFIPGKIRLSLSRSLEQKELDIIPALVGRLADRFKLNARKETRTYVSEKNIHDPTYEGVRSYLFEPDNYDQFKKQSN